MIKYVRNLFTDKENLFEMANFWPKDTGLNYVIWISEKSGREKHWPRIKVEVDNNRIPISIEDDPKIKVKNTKIKNFDTIKEFIVMNKDVLLKYWNKQISTPDLVQKLKKINYKDRG